VTDCARLGKKYLKEGVTPTTNVLNLLRYGPSHVEVDVDSAREVYLPQPWLRDISLVDTPGTNAVLRSHEQITREFIPRCDMIIFVTSADRAFSESERQFLKAIGEWSKKVVFVLNKIDLFESEEELEEVVQVVCVVVSRV
jgi:translation elongation factor EF-G